MAPLAMITALGAAMITYRRCMSSRVEGHDTDNDTDSEADEEDSPSPRTWPPNTTIPRRRIRLFSPPEPPHHPAMPRPDAYFNATEYLKLTRELNPNLDTTRILRPASLYRHLEADRRDQQEPVDSATENPQNQTDGHYTEELMRWMEMEGHENHHADRIKHDPIMKDQLKPERACLYIASRNMREELEDTIRTIMAQESELMTQLEEKSGAEDALEVEEEFAIFANGQTGTYRRHHEAVVMPKERTGIGQKGCSQVPLDTMIMGCTDSAGPTDQYHGTGEKPAVSRPELCRLGKCDLEGFQEQLGHMKTETHRAGSMQSAQMHGDQEDTLHYEHAAPPPMTARRDQPEIDQELPNRSPTKCTKTEPVTRSSPEDEYKGSGKTPRHQQDIPARMPEKHY